MKPLRRLSTQVVIMQVAILVVVMVAGFFVVQWNLRTRLYEQYEQRALAVAQTIASQRDIGHMVVSGRPGGELQKLAQAARRETGALFIVITNAQGIRYTHPNPALIGKPIYDDPEPPASEPFRTGRPWTGIQLGTLGLNAGGKVPLWYDGRLSGEVSVGFPVNQVSRQVASALPSLAVYLLVVLAVGVLAALGLSRRLKRQTFGLELGEIAALLQEREAMLHGIREGLLGYDRNERVLLANDSARRLLNLPPGSLGRPLRGMLPEGRLRDVVTGEVTGSDLLVLHGDRILVANRMPIRRDRRQHVGWVVTFQDRTESESLKRELDEALGLTETLRAQSHEFANRLHTLVGLVELGRYEEAVQFVTDVSAARGELTDQLLTTIGDPKLAALILAKVSLAAERDVVLRLMPDSHVEQGITHVSEVLTVVGNLIDNAIDAAAQAPAPRHVELTLVAAGSGLLIRVRDTGPGVPHDMREAIFMDGVTTKSSVTGARRGLGLALVRQVVQGRGGMISVGHDGGAVFTAVLPRCLEAAAEETEETVSP
ncbi:MAG: sensor histidine kinase [Streptosporangiaceae bacterium]|nr:sensor histidine kinase [Streptosporangiaceae bacterium]MBV9852951.1 sensor histidine kinase [Streptosporangiaceae bacterium]